MELEILNLLGLPNRPRRIKDSPLKKSAPRFLLDVYKTLMEDENSREERSVDFSGEEQNAIEKSDVIMTFESISKRDSRSVELDQEIRVQLQKFVKNWYECSEYTI